MARAGSWGKGGKVRNKSEKKPATSRYSQSAKGKGTKKLDFLLCEQFTVRPIRASHLALGKGRDGGVYSASWAQRPSGPTPGTVQAGVVRGYTRSLSLTAACPPPGVRPTWRPHRPLCRLRHRQRADGPRDNCGCGPGGGPAEGERDAARAGARGREGRAGTEAAQPAGSCANVPAIHLRASGTRGAQEAAPLSQQEERDPLRGPCP